MASLPLIEDAAPPARPASPDARAANSKQFLCPEGIITVFKYLSLLQ
jgi:hypothetical protein